MPPLNCTLTYPTLEFSTSHYYGARVTTNWIVFYIELIAPVVLLLVFFWVRERWDRTRVRHTRIVGLPTIGCILQAVVGPYTSAVGYAQIYCGLRSFISLIIVPLFVSAMMMRLMEFNLSRRLQLASKTFYERMLTEVDDEIDVQNERINPIRAVIFGFEHAVRHSGKESSSEDAKRNIATLRFLVRRKGFFSIIFVVSVPIVLVAIIRILTSPGMVAGCGGCKLANADIGILVAESIAGVVYGSAVAWRARHDRDPFGLLREAKLMMISSTIALFFFFLAVALPLENDSAFDWGILIAIFLDGNVVIMTVWQIGLAISGYSNDGSRRGSYRSSNGASRRMTAPVSGDLLPLQIKLDNNASPSNASTAGSSSVAVRSGIEDGTVKTAGPSKLKDVLTDPHALAKLEELLVDEWAIESLLFVKAVDGWKASYYDVSDGANIARARRIVNYFVLENAVCTVNLPYRVVMTLKSLVLAEAVKVVPYDVFDQARLEIAVIIEHGPLKRLYL